MKEHTLIVLSITLLCFFSFLVQETSTSGFLHNTGEDGVWYVDQTNVDGHWDGSIRYPFCNISEALLFANPYDTIFVLPGRYNEHITIPYPISLIGISTPILDGGYQNTIVTVQTSDVLIENILVTHSGGMNNDAGLLFFYGSNITIIDCIIHHSKNGVFLHHCSNVTFQGCSFFHNGNGINIKDSTITRIQECDFAHNAIGILTNRANDLILTRSTFVGNGISALFHQGSSLEIHNCNLSDNSVNKGGFILTNISKAILSNCLFYHNGDGISISNSDDISIMACSFLKNTHFALSLRQPSTNVVVSSCNLSENLRTAIYAESRNQFTVINCNIVDNHLYSVSASPLSSYLINNNWWGYRLGLFHPELMVSNKVRGLRGILSSIPWSSSFFSTVGAQIGQIPKPRYTHTFYEKQVLFLDGVDSDGDGVPDWWETKWGYDPLIWDDHGNLDPDGDGLTNHEECFTDEYGSNPFVKDVFLEIDWMHCDQQGSNKPNATLLQTMIDSFKENDITLHIDIGDLGGGESIPNHCDVSMMYAELNDIYWSHFLHNDPTNYRKGIFHYGVICNYCPDLNFPFMGWDAFDGFAVSAEWLEMELPLYEREQIIVGGIMHHLGHTLGLVADVFEGIDNVDVTRPFSNQWSIYRDYKSSMNYLYKYTILSYSDGSHGDGDFNDWGHLQFDFFKKSEFSTYSPLN